eukprot:572255_1
MAMLDSVDIGIFYGLRVIMTIGVIFIHTVGASYHFHLPSTMLPPRLLPDANPPIPPWNSPHDFFTSLMGSLFPWLLHGVNVFWFISGFLIAYRLYSLPTHYYPYFLFNRLLRVYPLFITYILFMYFSQA